MRIKHRFSKPDSLTTFSHPVSCTGKQNKKLVFLLSSKNSALPYMIESLQPTLENELDPSHLSQPQTAALPGPRTSQNHKVRIIL